MTPCLANNPKANDKASVDAHHLVGKIAAAIMKLYTKTPAILATRH